MLKKQTTIIVTCRVIKLLMLIEIKLALLLSYRINFKLNQSKVKIKLILVSYQKN